ncbi:MAG: flagellar basal body P-ring formation chaperone FlgA [Pirellulaceae bacterium]|nr:flagellar basal body P-ring formation chaperone FlgA [Pirellulaceae bacterium]
MCLIRVFSQPNVAHLLNVLFGCVAMVVGVALTQHASFGQEIQLRRSANITGSIVRLGDMADIQGGPAADRQALRQLVLAPYSSEHSVWSAREIREELAAAGWNLLYWEVTGSNQVQLIGPESVAGQQARQRKLSAVRGHVQPGFEINPLPQSDSGFATTHPSAQRTGVVQAQWQEELSGAVDPFDAASLGKAQRPQNSSSVWTFRHDMGRGQVVTAEDLEQTTIPRSLPSNAVRDAAQIVGQAVRSTVQAGRPILSQHLEPIKHVQRGKEVTLLSRVGPIEVSTTARSLADATIGQSVTIESLDRKRQFLGQVIGFNTVQVAGGQQTQDGAIVAQVTSADSQRSGNALRSGTAARPRSNQLR